MFLFRQYDFFANVVFVLFSDLDLTDGWIVNNGVFAGYTNDKQMVVIDINTRKVILQFAHPTFPKKVNS